MSAAKKIFKKYIALSLAIVIASFTMRSQAEQELISVFPLERYDQTVSHWINPKNPANTNSLLSKEAEEKRFTDFYDHSFGRLSPWQPEYVNQVLKSAAPNDIQSVEESIIKKFNNEGKAANDIGYGENFRAHDAAWIKQLAEEIMLTQFSALTYEPNQRGIAVDNLHARALPTEDVHFYSHLRAGEGYPFDNLQISALWAGTPLYILGETKDRAWMLVLTPDYIAWVKSSGIARVSAAFIETWTKAAKLKLAAITHTQTSLVDGNGKFLLSAYVGSVFPMLGQQLMVPVATPAGYATIKTATVPLEHFTRMPLTATPANFATLMQTMIGRPYGWGSMYFYNDCSAELKSLLTPFGIWLPRHSSEQVTVGKLVDMTAASPDKRLAYLMENGQAFLTLVYIGGHVVMYIGNYPDPNEESTKIAMTYQNIWGLTPNPPNRRAVIGQSVLFPMLLAYPEDTSLMSLAGKKYFQVSYLSELPEAISYQRRAGVNVRALMSPGD